MKKAEITRLYIKIIPVIIIHDQRSFIDWFFDAKPKAEIAQKKCKHRWMIM